MVYSKKKINLMKGGWSNKDIGFAVVVWILATAGTVVWAVLSFQHHTFDPIYTDAELDQKEQNKNNGLGDYTDAELDQKEQNKAAGQGNYTDAELLSNP